MIKSILATLMALSLGNVYPQTLVVTGINDDVLTLETATGQVYEYDGVEDYMLGDVVSVMFYDNGTELIYDDIIVDIRYSGFNY